MSYGAGALLESDLAADPLTQFRAWYDDAAAVVDQIPEPNAMVLATVGADGLPAARTVLLKAADGRGFTFFTNHGSRKGDHLAARPVAALTFPWIPVQRQVGARGPVERLPEPEVLAYWRSRPWASRIGAWVSRQSAVVDDRAVLEARWAELAARWPDRARPDDVPLPPFWGGYLVRPVELEFWQGRPSRLHDRLVFVPADGDLPPGGGPPPLDDPAAWRVERRQP